MLRELNLSATSEYDGESDDMGPMQVSREQL